MAASAARGQDAPAPSTAGPALGEPSPGFAVSPILTLDQERLFSGTLWGKRVLSGIEAESTTLASENRRLEAELTAEEAALTERRKSIEPAAFRAEADAFDAKVVAIRKAQDAKLRELTDRRDRERQAFFQSVLPAMQALVRERGALAILDGRAIVLSAQSIDATDDMIARIDAEFGDGAGRARALPVAPQEPSGPVAPGAVPPGAALPAPGSGGGD